MPETLSYRLGNTIAIGNPSAHSGMGERAIQMVKATFDDNPEVTQRFDLVTTQRPGDAWTLATRTTGYDTVVAIGGDGLVHEVVNGLMRIAEPQRPVLAIVPVGSGNDFARTLAETHNNPPRAIEDLMRGTVRALDLGLVDGAEPDGGTYFMQTLSFGLDAAIALDTTKRRENNSLQHGSGLFATSGLKILSTSREGWPFLATLVAGIGGAAIEAPGEHIEGNESIFAIQVGPTYGGGFKICPDAIPTDGLLDVCWAHELPSTPATLALFAATRFGRHVNSKHLNFRRASRIEITFPEGTPPTQIDGEPLDGNSHIIECVPNALRVIVPAGVTW